MYPNGSTKVRSLERKEFYWAEGIQPKAGLFGSNFFSSGEHKYVVITEGEIDAATLYQVLGLPCVSVRSASSAASDCISDLAFLSNFERIYLAFDGDSPGREATAAVARLFDYNRVWHVRFDKYKDANEYLQHREELELKNLWHNSRRYQPDSIVSTLAEFDSILKEPLKDGVPYPFPSLNRMTYGIRRGESVLFTAQEGVGKTEIMHAIEYQLLKETKDAVGAIFLEEPKRRHLQALAGLELQKPIHLPDCAVEPVEASAALSACVGTDDRLHVYSHFGSDDPDTILDTIRFLVTARQCNYIIFDHITMAVSGLGGEDERRALDYLSTRLEMMVKELNFALILVSHVNDDGRTRGSRYISKIADIRIDAVRDLQASDPVTRNTTHLTVSKNRFSGRTGPACRLLFDPQTYTYKELSDDQWEPANDVTGQSGSSSQSDSRAAA
jgi:twinkle protein